MIAIKIRVNGDLLYVIGQEDVSILNSNLVISRDNSERDVDDYIRLNAGGLSQDTDKGYPEHFRYKSQNLQVGDVVEMEIVDTDKIDAPVKRYRSDQEVQENPFTNEECREMRYNDYLQLKEEFEGGDES
jgi:hypothetical protein